MIKLVLWTAKAHAHQRSWTLMHLALLVWAQIDHFQLKCVLLKHPWRRESDLWMSTLHSHPSTGRNLETMAAFKGRRGGGKIWKRKTARLLIINSTEFWSWEARGKYIDVWKMLIKERSTLWFGRHPSAQAVWNLTAAWANGASNAFGETRHETQRRALMSLVDLSGTQDEWERWREDAEREEEATLGGRCLAFFLNFKANEGREILRWVKLHSHTPHRFSAGSQYWVTLQIGST